MAKDKISIEEHERIVRLKIYRKDAISIAKDFGYDDYIIDKINAAKTTDEISSIMSNARCSS